MTKEQIIDYDAELVQEQLEGYDDQTKLEIIERAKERIKFKQKVKLN